MEMTGRKRFLIGGAGAMMPILIVLSTIDYVAIFDNQEHLTLGHVIGFTIRYMILFIIGGVIAYLHAEEVKPLKVFQLGIAAPALLSSLISANGMQSVRDSADGEPTEPIAEVSQIIEKEPFSFSLIASAHAHPWGNHGSEEHNERAHNTANQEAEQKNTHFFRDMLRSLTGGAYGDIYKKKASAPAPTPQRAASTAENNE